jgi:DNA-binding NarL/FixJ family response regulator
MNRILIIEDHFVSAIGMEMIIKQHFKGYSVEIVANGKEGIEKLRSENFQLLILDLFLPETDTHAFVYKIKQLIPEIKILVYSSGPEKIYGPVYKMAGVNGFVSKNDGEEGLLLAIKSVLANKLFFDINALSTHFMNSKVNGNPFNTLSPRETEILSHILKGKSIGTIANDLNLQMSTISTMKMRLFRKLNVANVMDCARLALEFNYTLENIGSNNSGKNHE